MALLGCVEEGILSYDVEKLMSQFCFWDVEGRVEGYRLMTKKFCSGFRL